MSEIARQPRPHRLARRWGLSGLRGGRTIWKLADRLAPWPRAPLVEAWPGIVLVCDPTDYIAAGAYRGLYERAEARILPRLVGPGGFVVDVGANVGYHSALLSGLVGPGGRVVAFEPAPRCLRRLRMLVADAPLANVVVHPCAVGSERGRQILRDPGGETHSGLSTLRDAVTDGDDSVEVDVVRLCDVEEVGSAPTIDLLKIDVEGLEAEVLTGARPLLDEERVKHLIIEVSPNFGSIAYAVDLLADLADAYVGFEMAEWGRLFRRGHLRPMSAARLGETPYQFNLLLSRRDSVAAIGDLIEAGAAHR
ncbi:MAG: FkbM family methyltransferase [Acidimicrobiales bacterium]